MNPRHLGQALAVIILTCTALIIVAVTVWTLRGLL